MDTQITVALIGLAAALVGLVAALVTHSDVLQRFRNWRTASDPLDRFTGFIDAPRSGSRVLASFQCRGQVSGHLRGAKLWLVVERGNQLWPKEGEIVPDAKTGRWESTVFEDGARVPFDLSLYAVTELAHERIRRWLEVGRSTGSYPAQTSREGMRRLARVQGLAVPPN